MEFKKALKLEDSARSVHDMKFIFANSVRCQFIFMNGFRLGSEMSARRLDIRRIVRTILTTLKKLLYFESAEFAWRRKPLSAFKLQYY